MRVPLCALSFLSTLSQGLPGLPSLSIDNTLVSVSGISSGADLASHLAVAYSDVFSGAAIFAGEPWLCAVQRFQSEPLMTCATSPNGPGCVGFPSRSPCIGCPPDYTLTYDHCKQPAAGPGWVDVDVLTTAARSAEALGLISPTAALSNTRVLAFRGSRDTVYLDGSVNKTAAFFEAFGAQTRLVLSVPSFHALPTIDPAVPPSSCGTPADGPPAMSNCGYDGAGESLGLFFQGRRALTPPASHACDAACAAHLLAFNQSLYVPGDWAGGDLSSVAFVHIPPACTAEGARCPLHVSLHGCGMSVHSKAMALSYVTHSGYNAWGEANGIVTLYPQGGGFLERNEQQAAPSGQIGAGCFDGYGQTRADFGFRTGPTMATIVNMVRALSGGAEGVAGTK